MFSRFFTPKSEINKIGNKNNNQNNLNNFQFAS